MNQSGKDFTVQRRDTSVPVEDQGGRVGPLRPSASDHYAHLVGDRASVLDTTPGINKMVQNNTEPSVRDNLDEPLYQVEKEVDPFARRDSLSRTPPRERTTSFSEPKSINLEVSETFIDEATHDRPEQSNKRKRTENPFGSSRDKKAIDQPRETIQKIYNQIKALDKAIRESYNPKKDIKEAVYKLAFQAEKMQTKLFQEWIASTNSDTNEEKVRKLQEENKVLREEIRHITQNKGEEKPVNNTQCGLCREIQIKSEKRRLLRHDETYDAFQAVPENDWVEKIFPRMPVRSGNIWEAPPEYQLILPCSKDIEGLNNHVKAAVYKYGGIEGLKGQHKPIGGVASMRHSLEFPDDEGDFSSITRTIFYPIISDNKIQKEARDSDIFETLKVIKKLTLKNKKTKLAIPFLEGVTGAVVHRMVEFLFSDSTIEVVAYNPTVRDVSRVRKTSLYQENLRTANTPSKPKRPKEDALLMKMDGTTYAELLKTVKDTINPREIGVDVKDIQKSKNGDILVKIRNGSDKAEILRKEIKEKIPNITVSTLISKKVVHIKGMDELTTISDIREAISKAVNINQDWLEIRALRPSYRDKQNVTIITREDEADKLLQLKVLKIGWVDCKITERKKDDRCYKCWEYGHNKTECKGPDREQLCMRCGEEGHKAATCKKVPFCLSCKQKGHQTGSRSCSEPKGGASKKTEDENL